MPPEHVLAPPPRVEPREALLIVVERPVVLWRQVVDPPFSQPSPRIGERLGVGIQTGYAGRIPRPPDPEWTDTDEHPPFTRFDFGVQRSNEVVDVRSAPRSTIGPSARHTVALPRHIVGNAQRHPLRDSVALLAAL